MNILDAAKAVLHTDPLFDNHGVRFRKQGETFIGVHGTTAAAVGGLGPPR